MARLPAILVVALPLVCLLGVGAGGVRADEESRDEDLVEIVSSTPLRISDFLEAVQHLPPPWPAVVAHPETSSLLLHGPEAWIAGLERVIAEMDGDG